MRLGICLSVVEASKQSQLLIKTKQINTHFIFSTFLCGLHMVD